MFENTHFPKAKKIWRMGKFYEWSAPQVHSMSHALHYGTCVFEGIRAYSTPKGPAVFRMEDHTDRFLRSAAILKMSVPYSKEEIMDTIKLVVRENQLEAAYIRPLLFYSYGNLGLIPKFSPVELIMAAWEWGAYLGENSTSGVHTYLLPWRRVHHSQYDMSAKLGGIYVQSTICGLMAREKGYDEGIFLNMEGNIAEGPGENIFILESGQLRTNDRTESVLEGITRSSIIKIAKDMGIPTSIGSITKEQFLNAEEAFFSGTAVEVVPITKVTDGSNSQASEKHYTIGSGKPGPMTQKLRSAYKNTVSGMRKEYESWLSYVNE